MGDAGMTTAQQEASVKARALNHLPGPWKEFGVMRLAKCQRLGCKMVMVLNTEDGEGPSGSMLKKRCGGQK
jgi:hypothetical protein